MLEKDGKYGTNTVCHKTYILTNYTMSRQYCYNLYITEYWPLKMEILTILNSMIRVTNA